jgi:flavin-dependent dehydrogenase
MDALYIRWSSRHEQAYAWAFPAASGLVNVGFGMLARHHQVSRARLLHELAQQLPILHLEGTNLAVHRPSWAGGERAVFDRAVSGSAGVDRSPAQA